MATEYLCTCRGRWLTTSLKSEFLLVLGCIQADTNIRIVPLTLDLTGIVLIESILDFLLVCNYFNDLVLILIIYMEQLQEVSVFIIFLVDPSLKLGHHLFEG